MEKRDIDAYVIPMGDYHGSEYISPHFNLISYYSSFSGSAGTLVFIRDGRDLKEGALFTDGRYYLQGEQQLEDTGLVLMRQGMPDVPEVWNYIADNAAGKTGGLKLGFDAKSVDQPLVEKIEKECRKRGTALFTDGLDIAGKVWDEDITDKRAAIPCNPVWRLDKEHAGVSTDEKLQSLRDEMKSAGADVMVITALDEIAYLLNLRGEDVEYNPVFMSFLIVRMKDITLYTDAANAAQCLENDTDIRIKPYGRFFDDVSALDTDDCVWYDMAGASRYLYECIQKGRDISRIIDRPSPLVMMKAVKNSVEIDNIKKAHIKDAVAVTRWIYDIKMLSRAAGGKGGERLTELEAAAGLEEERRKQENYIGQSFAPIIAFASHGAIVHYEPTPESDAVIEFDKGDFLLADTGGHYLEGTTDITRTISLGDTDDKKKKLYTAVLKGHLRLLGTCFPEGISGQALDHLAREPLYELGLDYRHGTGHGVGYLLNVHEGPNSISMRYSSSNRMMEGMVTSDEPGVYIDNCFGIRIESLVLTVFDKETEYGRFLRFEPLTLVPFDRESIIVSDLSEREKQIMNAYNKKVYDTLASFLSEDQKSWLKVQTAGV